MMRGAGIARTTSRGPTAHLIISFGESNSGGYADNADAPSWETGVRSEVQMWNVTTSGWQTLDIGQNNNLDHSGLTSSTHGWELGLANRVRQGYFSDRTIYYLQTGQGASTVAQWNVGGAYWTKFLARVAAVKASMSNLFYTTHIWISLGINDAIAGTSDSTYKSSFQEIISRIKTELPGCKIYIATLPPVNGTYTTYSTRIAEIAAEDPNTVRLVSVTSPVTLDMRDTNHWSYKGMKRLAARMVDATLADLSMPGSGLTWSAREDANYIYTSAVAQHTHVPVQLNVTNNGYVAFEYTGDSAGLVCALDTDNSEVNWTGSDPYIAAVYPFGGTMFYAVTNGGATSATESTPCWVRFRWSAINDDLYLETSIDGGINWTLRNTFIGALAGLSTAYLKALSAIGAASVDVWTGTYQGEQSGGTLLLDIYSSAGAAYSTRKLRANYSGSALRVRRSSDSSLLNIGFDSSGNLDTSALLTFIGAENGLIDTWYDQSGYGRDLTAASGSEQPSIVNAGSLVTEGSRPALSFDGTKRLATGDVVSTGSSVSVFMACKSTTNARTLFELGSPYALLLAQGVTGSPSNLSVFPISGGGWGEVAVNINRYAVAGLAGNGTNFTAFSNADTASGVMSVMSAGTNEIGIAGHGGGFKFTGTMQECIVWFSDKRTDRAAIAANINSYYAIY